MSVSASDIHFYRSANGASAGGTRSPTAITNAVKNNLFDDISDASRVAGGSQVKKWFFRNENATDSLVSPLFWLSQPPQNLTDEIGLGFDDGDDDTANAGNMTAFTAASVVAAVSSGPDTRSLQVYGVDSLGAPQIDNLVLNGTTEVLGTVIFAKVWAVKAAAELGTNTVTISQGSGGATRGTIAANTETCFLWLSPVVKANGMRLPSLGAGASFGFWERITWAAGATAVRPNTSILSYEEGT